MKKIQDRSALMFKIKCGRPLLAKFFSPWVVHILLGHVRRKWVGDQGPKREHM